jgi:hypothetical protein
MREITMPKYRVRVPELVEHIVEVDCVDEQSAMILAYKQVMEYDEGYTTESLGVNAHDISVEFVLDGGK